ncbi:hypothetical protein PR048_022685 [Dryococelus australis]|uniref:Uncharacterized protein n=1 Tax=Dryococelus australis TaxID=614101 RepID=A0ABQ9GRY7_9NEOP|nr:hypothetical protein PR048_022685 [Dryococelus australis]
MTFASCADDIIDYTFQAYTHNTAIYFVGTHPWYNIPLTVHKRNRVNDYKFSSPHPTSISSQPLEDQSLLRTFGYEDVKDIG